MMMCLVFIGQTIYLHSELVHWACKVGILPLASCQFFFWNFFCKGVSALTSTLVGVPSS